jgi:hypothetical protein
VVWQRLDGDHAVEPQVACEQHHAHSATP